MFPCIALKELLQTSNHQDLKTHCEWTDRLLSHYTQTFRDREIYYVARQRATTCGDILVCIIDSFDKGKLALPRWAFGRTPKKPVYEATHRPLPAFNSLCNIQ